MNLNRKTISDKLARLSMGADIIVLFSATWPLRKVVDYPMNEFVDIFVDELLLLSETVTVVVPTFTWDFTQSGIFDYENSASKQGVISEKIRSVSTSIRSLHPINSYCAIGPKSSELKALDPRGPSWGEDNIVGWFRKNSARCITLGLPWKNAFTPIHAAELSESVPYRYSKKFEGVIRIDGLERACHEMLYVGPRDIDLGWSPCFIRNIAIKNKMIIDEGEKEIIFESINASDLLGIASEAIRKDAFAFVNNKDTLLKHIETPGWK